MIFIVSWTQTCVEYELHCAYRIWNWKFVSNLSIWLIFVFLVSFRMKQSSTERGDVSCFVTPFSYALHVVVKKIYICMIMFKISSTKVYSYLSWGVHHNRKKSKDKLLSLKGNTFLIWWIVIFLMYKGVLIIVP